MAKRIPHIKKLQDKLKEKNKMTTPVISDFNGYLLGNQRQVTMSVNGLKCNFHMPKALTRQFDHNGKERACSLPPGAPRAAFAVDEYPACPDSWMHGSATASSYFVPIKEDHGMWLDMCENANDTHHVAAVISIQGINPITGQKSDPIRLEQYKTKCPVHDIDFKQDLFCEKCKHKWPPQNYISTNNGAPFWLDGFMAEDGVVRQWIFTEEEAKGVAAQMIKQERVFAIGIAFYRSKEPKPVKPVNVTRSASSTGSTGSYCASNIKWLSTEEAMKKHPGLYADTSTKISSISASKSADWSTLSQNDVYTCNADSPGPTGMPGIQGPLGPSGPTGPTGPTGSFGMKFDPMATDEDYFIPVKDGGPAGMMMCAPAAGGGCAAGGLEAEEKTSGGIPLPPPTLKEKLLAKHGSRRRTTRGPSGQSVNNFCEMPESLGRVTLSADDDARGEIEQIPEVEIKKLEVGAGAKIDQKIYRDPQNLDFWQAEPVGFIYINYTDEETAKRIIAAGKREESTEGFLNGLALAVKEEV